MAEGGVCCVVWVLLLLLLSCPGSCKAVQGRQEDAATSVAPSRDCVTLEERNLPSRYVQLPNNVTVKPHNTTWRLDMTIHSDQHQDPLSCISLAVIGEKIRLSLFVGKCEDQDIVDFQLWKPTYVMPLEWTTIHVRNNASFVILQVEGSDLTPLVTDEVTLPKQGLLRVTHTQTMNLALGCRVNCPAALGSRANTTDLSTIRELKKPNERFFFRPGKDFARLNFEMNCETPLGHEVSVGDTDLTSEDIEALTPLRQWHKVFLDFDGVNGVFKIIIDYRPARELASGLQACSTFTSFSVRAAGETLVSFTCDPVSGEVAIRTPDEHCDCSPQQLRATVFVTLFFVAFLIVIFTVVAILRCFGYVIKIKTINKPKKRDEIYKKLCCENSEQT